MNEREAAKYTAAMQAQAQGKNKIFIARGRLSLAEKSGESSITVNGGDLFRKIAEFFEEDDMEIQITIEKLS